MASTPDAPPPLDTGKLAGQQRNENLRTANQNASFNRLNQRDQFGNTIRYVQNGTDANGNPRFSVNQSLGGFGRDINSGMRGLAGMFFDGARDKLNNPLDVNADVENRIYNLGASRLDPRMDRSRAALENRLANQGIAVGSEAYTNAMNDFGQQENDAYNSLALQARGQAFNEGLTDRNQGLNELRGLAGLGVNYGMGTVNPNFANVPQIGIPGIDTIGLEQMRYNQDYQNYQNELNNRNAMLGGLAGLGGTLLTLPMGGGASLGGSLIGGLFK